MHVIPVYMLFLYNWRNLWNNANNSSLSPFSSPYNSPRRRRRRGPRKRRSPSGVISESEHLSCNDSFDHGEKILVDLMEDLEKVDLHNWTNSSIERRFLSVSPALGFH